MKKLIIGATALGSLLVSGIASAATFNVPLDYSTIQAAVTAADPGDTITVDAGTYMENVVVDRALTLQGAGASSTFVDAGNTGAAFQILANDVTIDGFTVQNGGSGLNSGIWMGDPMNVTISHNTFTNNMFGIWADCGGNCVIENNLFDGNNTTGGSGAGGISADSTNGLTIRNNEFKNEMEGNPILLQAVGLGAHTNLEVSGNSLHDNAFSGVYALGVDGGIFTGNTIVATDATGLSFSGGNTNITITNNSITNSARGIRIEDAGYGFGPNSAFTLSGNTFSGNTDYNVGVLPGGYVGTEFEIAPTITLNGDANMTVFSSNGFTDPGATAVDFSGTSIAVVTSGTVGTQPGSYTVTYTATDALGNTASTNRTVIVKSASSGSGRGGGRGNSSGAASPRALIAVNNAGVVLPSQAASVIGQVLGASTSAENEEMIAEVKVQLRGLISQLLELLKQKLALALVLGSY